MIEQTADGDLMSKFENLNIFGLEARVTDVRVSENPEGFGYKYDMRHSDSNWVDPVTIEPKVWVNFCGSIFFKESLQFSNNSKNYIELSDDE